MRIREATTKDTRRIAEIHVRSWQAAYRSIMPEAVLEALSIEKREQFWAGQLSDKKTRRTLVAEITGEVCGWAGYGACRDADASEAGEVYGIYLDPGVYRRGIGRLLWSGVMKRLASQGFGRVAVWVLEANLPARRFYEAMGGELDSNATKAFEREGVTLPEVRYWFPVRRSR